jgi:cytochrome bd ubiquinol oxidase subunit I
MSALASTAVDLARIQFATTSIYHFLFVPLALGLGPLVAIMQTIWQRTGNEAWLRLTRFFGTLFLINFAIGVATGPQLRSCSRTSSRRRATGASC